MNTVKIILKLAKFQPHISLIYVMLELQDTVLPEPSCTECRVASQRAVINCSDPADIYNILDRKQVNSPYWSNIKEN